MVKKFNPQVIFLIETKRKILEMDWLRARWKFDRCFVVEGIGKGGSLALLWMEERKVEIRSFSKYHIDARISDTGAEKS